MSDDPRRSVCIEDINRVYAQLREHAVADADLRSGVEHLKARLRLVEEQVAEHHSLLVELKTLIAVLEKNFELVVSGQQHIESNIQAMNSVLLRHTVEEAERGERQIVASQRTTRYIIAVFAVMASLLSVMASLHSHFAGKPLHESLMHIMGLLG